jgi:predicted AlkP superfamily phosphohydrolase/phosphomutase
MLGRVNRALRILLLAVPALLLVLAFADVAGSRVPERAPAPAHDAHSIGRFVVLAFDGVAPEWIGRAMDEGRCPNLDALRREGAFVTLATEIPPESPVAWASFLTGMNPGRHAIFDFVRPGADYRPEPGMVEIDPMRLLGGRVAVRAPQARSLLAAPTYLERIHDAGYPVLALRQPLAFPVRPRPGLRVVSGLGTPDIAASSGLYSVWDAQIGYTAGETQFGGERIPISAGGEGHVYETHLPGPFDRSLPRGPSGALQRARVPLRFEVLTTTETPSVRITLQGRSEVVAKGERSAFFPVTFALETIPVIRVKGHVRMEVKETDPLRVFADPINLYAPDPPLPISSPDGYAAQLWERYGPFETVGWSEQTFQVNDLIQDDAGFLRDLLQDMDRNAGMLLGELARGGRCVFHLFTATDRACHVFYRYYDEGHPLHESAMSTGLKDPVGTVFEKMDRIVGDVRATLDPDDVLFVVSDHGFQTWRWSMNVNRWLVDEGLLVFREPDARERTLGGFAARGDMGIERVDWSRTKAFAMGLGQIYVNERGFFPEGSVAPDEIPALLGRIEERILRYVNPYAPEEAPVRRVFRLREVYEGPHAAHAPHLQLGFAVGYRVSWQTALLGGMNRPVIEENRVPWSGDHCSTDPDAVPGVLFVNRRIAGSRAPHVRDVAATALEWFGLPWDMLDGEPIPLEGSR